MGLKQKIEEDLLIGSCVSIWATWAMYLRFSLRLDIESNRDKISLDCFPSLQTINMYPLLFVRESVITSRKQQLSAHRHP